MLCAVLSLSGLFACVESRETAREADPESPQETAAEHQPASDELLREAPETSSFGACCIDYTCPSPDFDTTGCKVGAGPSIREAFETCAAYCSVSCTSSGLYCY